MTWLYHHSEGARLFQDHEVPAKLREGWADHPNAVREPEPPKPAPKRWKGKA